MNRVDIVHDLQALHVGRVVEAPVMKDYTTYKVGGEAIALVYPESTSLLQKLLLYLREKGIRYKIIGRGSNLIFKDTLYDGVIIKLDCFDSLHIDDTKVSVGAGYSLMKLAIQTAKMGLGGLEFASGIPGSVGGAIFMNAGAYKSDMGYIVSEIQVLTPNLEVKTLYNKDLDFHYRTSFLQKNPDYICLSATIILKKVDKKELLEIMEDRKQRRLLSQPLEYPSAGSVFRNPTDGYAGEWIENLGYKGKKIGGAMVSEKHANFVINIGDATSEDIRKLILEIQEKIYEMYHVWLKVEQEFVE